MTKPPTSSTGSNPPSEVTSSDGDSSGTIIAIAVVVAVALLIVFTWLSLYCFSVNAREGTVQERLLENEEFIT
jgi:hypothetical protein